MVSIAPTSATTSAAVSTEASKSFSTLSSNFDTFIKLLTAQVQYQDPLEPTDTSQFTQQLVQYSQVEQQIGTNDKLDKVIGTLAISGGQQYLNYIGRTIDANASQAILRNGEATVGYKLPDNATAVEVKILDKNGQVIRTLAGPATLGNHSVTWDGKNEAGQTQNSGAYTFKVTAKNAEGADMRGVTQYITTKVIGIQSDSKGAQLDVGNGFTIDPVQVYNVRDETI